MVDLTRRLFMQGLAALAAPKVPLKMAVAPVAEALSPVKEIRKWLDWSASLPTRAIDLFDWEDSNSLFPEQQIEHEAGLRSLLKELHEGGISPEFMAPAEKAVNDRFSLPMADRPEFYSGVVGPMRDAVVREQMKRAPQSLLDHMMKVDKDPALNSEFIVDPDLELGGLTGTDYSDLPPDVDMRGVVEHYLAGDEETKFMSSNPFRDIVDAHRESLQHKISKLTLKAGDPNADFYEHANRSNSRFWYENRARKLLDKYKLPDTHLDPTPEQIAAVNPIEHVDDFLRGIGPELYTPEEMQAIRMSVARSNQVGRVLDDVNYIPGARKALKEANKAEKLKIQQEKAQIQAQDRAAKLEARTIAKKQKQLSPPRSNWDDLYQKYSTVLDFCEGGYV